ncbi:peptidase [Halosegnis marinus]|uniref:Peptidase n=1 Tax=Halosegnis marinus TaxID=3034023 RepID=A0ABD5ZP73_9EURY|nr:peptidase [Halosegnis sp. DT85]
MTVVVTGYEPFGEFDRNPSAAVAERVDGATVRGESVVGRVLPVEFDGIRAELTALLDEHDPDLLVATGLAGGTPGIRVERVGVNVADAVTTPDNAERDPADERIAGGPAAYFATLPTTAVVAELLDAGIPARLSNTAGTHLCNDALYTGRHLVETEGYDARVGFVHLPFDPEGAVAQGRENGATRGGSVPASLPLDVQERAIRLAIGTGL